MTDHHMAAWRMFIWRYWHPVYRQVLTLDCPAATPELALAKARRFLASEIRRIRRAIPGSNPRLRVPNRPEDMIEEQPLALQENPHERTA